MKKFILLNLMILFVLTLSAQVRMPDEKIVFKKCEQGELSAEIYYPNSQKNGKDRGVVILLFGGGWMGGTPSQFYAYCDFFSSQGFVAISGDYRVITKHNTTPFESVEDTKSLVRWVRQNADELGIDPEKVIIGGGSAGGHVALCTEFIKGCEGEGEDLSISSRPNYIIGFNPVLDTTEEGYGWTKVEGRETEISPNHHIGPGAVNAPTLLLHGTSDKTVPFQNAITFNRRMLEEGNRCTFIPYWGSNHGFFNDSSFRATNSNRRYNDILIQIARFLNREGFNIDTKDIDKDPIRVAVVGDFESSYAKVLAGLVGDRYRFDTFGSESRGELTEYEPDIVITTTEITSEKYSGCLAAIESAKVTPEYHIIYAPEQKKALAEIKELFQTKRIVIHPELLERIDTNAEQFALDTYNSVAVEKRAYISDDISKIESIEGIISPAEFHQKRGGLANSYKRFSETKKGRVAFLGGSITFNNGWRNYLCDYLERRFPDTEFTFIAAGIPSEGSTSGAFRLERDVLSKGDIDLLFVESAVNDRSPALARNSIDRVRGAEGIIRHTKSVDSQTDIVAMYFVDPSKMEDYNSGKTPQEVLDLDSVSEHYNIPSINLAKEITDRIGAEEFTWESDFINLHPSPFGQKVYYRSMHHLLESCYSDAERGGRAAKYKMPKMMDSSSYCNAEFIPTDGVTLTKGWSRLEYQAARSKEQVIESWYGAEPIEFRFKGSVIGIRAISGADTGMVEFSIDGGEWEQKDQFTTISHSITLPRYIILKAGLDPKKEHTIRIRPIEQIHKLSKGTSCRITDFMVNH